MSTDQMSLPLNSNRIDRSELDRLVANKDNIIDSLRSQLEKLRRRNEVDTELSQEKDNMITALKRDMEETKSQYELKLERAQQKLN